MAEVKSHEFERFLGNALQRFRIFVIYGPDRGLVSERAGLLAGKTGIATDDPFALVKLDITDLQGDPGRLIDEVNALGLFGGQRLVWLRGAMNEKPLLDAMQHIAEAPAAETILIVEAGDLKKGSGLRKIAEPAPSIAVIACYGDDARSLNALIDVELGGENLPISPGARQRLLELLGGDRIASRNEIRKLALYCRGETLIEEHHIDEIIGDASAISTDEAVDAILTGDLVGFERAMQKLLASKTPVFLVLQACLKQLQMLDAMKAEMEEAKLPAGQVMASHGRNIHFRRKPIIEKVLRNWSAANHARETERLQSAIFLSRRHQTLETGIALHMLMATTLQSRQQAAR